MTSKSIIWLQIMSRIWLPWIQRMIRPKKNICLFKLPRPTLIFTPDPKSFYGISETQEGNVVSKCIYIRILPVFQRPKAPIQDQKTFQALNK